MISGMNRVLLSVLRLIKEDEEFKEGVVTLLAAIADNQAAKAEYRRSLAARHKKGSHP